MTLRLPKAILFDLGGTVLEEQWYDLQRGFRSIEDKLDTGANLDALNSAMAAYLGTSGTTSEFSLLNWIAEHSSQHQADELEWLLWESTVGLAAQDNIYEALDQLASANIKIAAITNTVFSASCVRRELAKRNLLAHFDFVLSSADLGIKKPDPRIFQTALDHLGNSVEDVVFIGDNLNADVEGSASMGMTPIWFGEHALSSKYLTLAQWSEFRVREDGFSLGSF